jgi:hypothetical protein
VVKEHHFRSNSQNYGEGHATGGASTWDAVKAPKPHEVESLLSLTSEEPSESERRSYHGATVHTASINNILGSETNRLTDNAPELGKHRSNNPTDAANRVDKHTPSTKEKLTGKIKVLFGKASGNSDIISSGEALRDGEMEPGSK